MARPITYDEKAVVSAALDQFWAEGYKRTSVDMLVSGTGLNKHSLYQSFGGKSGLFQRVLEDYLARYSRPYLEVFERHRGLPALKAYFQAVLRKTDPRGCLVANTAVELGEAEPECRRLVTNYYNELAACFAVALDEGRRDGSIRAELDARDTAIWLVRTVQGLAVSARLGGLPRPAVKAMLALLAAPGQTQN